MISTTNDSYLLPPVDFTRTNNKSDDLIDKPGSAFGNMFENIRSQKSEDPKTLDEAGRKMEVMITTMMLKTMEESSTEDGLLGTKSQGMGHFKDLFLEKVAEDMVEKGGLGIRDALAKAYGTK